MRDMFNRWAFLFKPSKWANRITFFLFCGVFVFLLFQAFAITIPERSIALDWINSLRDVIGLTPINPWRDWLYDFQSLIGGILAIVAAAFTVLQMRLSDERSERRHKEILQLQLRSDGLRLERMYFSLHPYLNRADNIFYSDFIPGMPIPDRLLHMSSNDLGSLFVEIDMLWNETEEFFFSRVFQDAEDLLDGSLTDEVADFRDDL